MTESFDPSQYLQQMASMRSSFGGPPTITTQISFGSKRQAYSPLSTRNTSDGAASPGQGQSTAFEKGFDDAIDKKMLAEKNDDERKKREQEADDALMKRFVDNTLKHLDKRSKAALKSAGVEHFFDYAHPLIHPIVANDYVGVMNVLQNVPIDGREEFVNKVDEVGGCPPIFYCLESHQLEILQLLLDYGADVNARNDLRNTPLHIACLRTQRRAVRALIFHGADAMVENSGFEKAHKMAPDAEQLPMLNYLNVCVEEYKEALGEKQIYKMNRKTRAYYRSLYDMLDSKDMSYISYADIPDKLNSVYDNEVLAPNLIDVLSFFKWLDRDKDGLIDFPEFLRGCILYALNVEKNKKKKKKKGKRGGKKAKKRSGGGFASPR